MVILQEVQNREDYLPLLLLADESEEIVNEYLNEGTLFSITYKQTCAGVCLFTFPSPSTVEIKNLAIKEEMRGSGLGRATIQWAVTHFRKKGFKQMIVGTSNSSIDNILFYQKTGFRFHEIKRDFFSHYPHVFYENGIQGMDMIVFERRLDNTSNTLSL